MTRAAHRPPSVKVSLRSALAGLLATEECVAVLVERGHCGENVGRAEIRRAACLLALAAEHLVRAEAAAERAVDDIGETS